MFYIISYRLCCILYDVLQLTFENLIHKSPSENSSNDRLGAIENKVEDLQKCVKSIESTLSVLLETINLHFLNSKN